MLSLKNQKKLSLYKKVDDYMDVSTLEGFTLNKYITTRQKLCEAEHVQHCTLCTSFINVAKHIAENGFIQLNTAFRMTSPNIKYKSKDAKRKLLQMPLAALRINTGKKEVIYLVAKNNNLTLARSMLGNVVCEENNVSNLSKMCVRELLKAAESDAERERITFAIAQASGQSNTKLRRLYGFEDLGKRKARVEDSLREAMEIREACETIASIQEKAVLKSFGIDVESDSDIEDDESETDSEGEDMLCAVDSETTGGDMKSGPIPLPQTPGNAHLVGQNDSTGTVQKPCSTDQQENAVLISGNPEYVMDLLRSCRLNWFEFVGRVRQIIVSLRSRTRTSQTT